MPTSTTERRWPATVAVETARIGSSGLSAYHYAIMGLAVHPAFAAGLGILAAAVDYIKGSAFTVACTPGHGFVRRVTAAALFAVLLPASLVAVDGVLLKLRTHWTAGPADVIQRHDDAESDLRAAKDELATLAAVRTTEQIRASMEQAPVPANVFRRTKECTDITKEESRAACAPLSALRIEMAGAIRKRDLEAKRDELQGKLAALGPRPAVADPQASVFAAATGLRETFMAWILVAVFGFAVEVVACFGRFALSKPAKKADKKPDNRPNTPASVTALTATDADLEAVRRLVAPDDRGSPPPPDGRSLPKPPKPVRPDTPEGSPNERLRGYVLTRLALGESIPSQVEIEDATGIPRSTVSDGLSEMERDGLIVRRTVGRCKAIVAV